MTNKRLKTPDDCHTNRTRILRDRMTEISFKYCTPYQNTDLIKNIIFILGNELNITSYYSDI